LDNKTHRRTLKVLQTVLGREILRGACRHGDSVLHVALASKQNACKKQTMPQK
jgi:hypothetical protein